MKLLKNILFLLGIASIVVMLCNMPMSWEEVWHNLQRAGLWFPAVVVLWLFIYIINARAWQLIIGPGVAYLRVLRLTISGYALNNVTPMGLLGGEPYRIMELTPQIGAERASSSVILYSMMHIFSHFCFWTFSILLFLVLYSSLITLPVALFLLLVSLFCALGVYFFMMGYRYGLAMRCLRFFSHIPFLRARLQGFIQRNEESISRVDQQIAALHARSRRTFYSSLGLEFLARMVGCVELMFILMILTDDVSYWDCVLMQAFMSLFANLLFVIPMQMGTREGGFAMVTSALSMSGAYGVLTGLITRLREMIWDVIGLLLMKL